MPFDNLARYKHRKIQSAHPRLIVRRDKHDQGFYIVMNEALVDEAEIDITKAYSVFWDASDRLGYIAQDEKGWKFSKINNTKSLTLRGRVPFEALPIKRLVVDNPEIINCPEIIGPTVWFDLDIEEG